MRQKRTRFTGVRLTPEIDDLLREVSSARGEDVSDFIRRAILRELASLSFLSTMQKKALGVPSEKVDDALTH